jgi:hypothetical protein
MKNLPIHLKAIHKLWLKRNRIADKWDVILEQGTIVFHATFTHQTIVGKDSFDARLVAQEVKETYLDWPQHRTIKQQYEDAHTEFISHSDIDAYSAFCSAEYERKAAAYDAKQAAKIARRIAKLGPIVSI